MYLFKVITCWSDAKTVIFQIIVYDIDTMDTGNWTEYISHQIW